MNPIPNYRDSLVLEAARVEGEGNRATVQVRSFDILGFDVESGVPVPVTLLGLPLPADGSVYVIFNRIDKSRTLLDGTRFADFKPFADFVRAEADRAALWARGPGTDSPSQHGSDPGPTSGSGAGGSALIGGLAGVPARWK